MKDEDSSLLDKIRSAFEALDPSDSPESYPEEALKPGTFVRATRLDKLGVIYDAFYDGLDKDKKKIITYSILLLPTAKPFKNDLSSLLQESSPKYYMTNEYEYDVIGYLMINPIDMSRMNLYLERRLF